MAGGKPHPGSQAESPGTHRVPRYRARRRQAQWGNGNGARQCHRALAACWGLSHPLPHGLTESPQQLRHHLPPRKLGHKAMKPPVQGHTARGLHPSLANK